MNSITVRLTHNFRKARTRRISQEKKFKCFSSFQILNVLTNNNFITIKFHMGLYNIHVYA